MTTLNRRAFASGASLAAIAAVPAAAQCGLFPTLAEVSASPDHELLVRGAQLRRAHDEAEEASAAFHAANTPMLDKAWELTLATGLDAKSTAASEMYHDIALQLRHADPRIGELDRAQKEAWKRYDVIAAQIVALPCQTLDGLAVKALLVQHGWPTAFEPEVKDVDGADEQRLRHLVDEMMRLAVAA